MILLTGHKGFVGSALFKELDNCIGFDLPENDITNFAQVRQAIEKADTVIHMAAIADLYETAKDLYNNLMVNVVATFDIANQCARRGKKLIFISTCCVYGGAEDIEFEDSWPQTIEPYACSKMAAEYLIRGFENLDWTILRIGTVYGPGMRDTLFNRVAIEKVSRGEKIAINGDGTQTRNYIYIDDLVDGIKLTVKELPKREIINICGNESVSVNDTIRVAEEVTGKKAVKEYGGSRYGEIPHENISIEKAYRLLGWEPEISYKDGMKNTLVWLRENEIL